VCVCLCAHVLLKLSCLPCGFLCCFLHERPRLPELAPPPNASPTPHERRGAPTCAQPGTNPQVQSAGWQELPPSLLTRLLIAEEEWVRTPPNFFTCYTTFVFITCFVCVRVFFALPAYRLTAIVSCSHTCSDTDTVHTTSRQHSEKQKYMNIHK